MNTPLRGWTLSSSSITAISPAPRRGNGVAAGTWAISGPIPAAIRRAYPGTGQLWWPPVRGSRRRPRPSRPRRPTTLAPNPGRVHLDVRPGRPARGISSRGMGRPARVAMNPRVPARPWSRGVIQKTIASPGARFLDSDVKLVGAAGGSRSSGPSVTVKNGALARFCSRLYTNRLGKMRSWNRSPWWVHSDPESSKTSNPRLSPAARAARTAGVIGILCQPSPSGGVASAIPQFVPPLPRITWQRSPPGRAIDQGRSEWRRWRNVGRPLAAHNPSHSPRTTGPQSLPRSPAAVADRPPT